jgi:hypothetical protein
MFDKIASVLTGGLAGTIMDGIKSYFPPDMSDQQKAALNLELQKIELQKQAEVNDAISEAQKSFNDRIAQYEGTAKDLLALPVVGRILLFLRGAQRPVWGFATLWADYCWFSSAWGALTEKQETALIIINILVLGFLFGERAIKNLEPLIGRLLSK